MENIIVSDQDKVERKYNVLSYLGIAFLLLITITIFLFPYLFIGRSLGGINFSWYFWEILYYSVPVFTGALIIFILNRRKNHKKTVLFALLISALHLAWTGFFYYKNLKEEEITSAKYRESYEAREKMYKKCMEDCAGNGKKCSIFQCTPPLNAVGRPYRSRKLFSWFSREAEIVRGKSWR